jgi:hypothetical protein
LQNRVREVLNLELPILEWCAEEGIDPDALDTRILAGRRGGTC